MVLRRASLCFEWLETRPKGLNLPCGAARVAAHAPAIPLVSAGAGSNYKTEFVMSNRADNHDGDKRRNKGGRPKKEAAEKLKYKVVVRLSTGDYYALKSNAKAAKLPLAEVARQAVIGCRIVSRFTTEQAWWMRNLVGMGNNLNQLTKLAHQRGYDNQILAANLALGKEISRTLKLFRNDGQDS